jgi:hypothetical protein
MDEKIRGRVFKQKANERGDSGKTADFQPLGAVKK